MPFPTSLYLKITVKQPVVIAGIADLPATGDADNRFIAIPMTITDEHYKQGNLILGRNYILVKKILKNDY